MCLFSYAMAKGFSTPDTFKWDYCVFKKELRIFWEWPWTAYLMKVLIILDLKLLPFKLIGKFLYVWIAQVKLLNIHLIISSMCAAYWLKRKGFNLFWRTPKALHRECPKSALLRISWNTLILHLANNKTCYLLG